MACILLLVLWSCGDRQPPSIVIPLQREPELATRLTVAGATAWFIFDTGAGAHTLARWFAESARLAADDSLRDAVRGRDAGGEPVVFSVVRDVHARLPDGTMLDLESPIVTDFPPEFEQGEVGGLLNPQLLAGDGRAVVLDLRVPELRFERVEDAVCRLGARTLSADQVQRCREPAAVPNLLYAVLATAGGQQGWLQLDTGAGTTTIPAGSPVVAGSPLEPGGETMGVAGRPQRYSVARGLVISFAGVHTTVDAQVVEAYHHGCGSDGLLGRDALSRCALVFSQDSLAISCQ